MCTDMIDTNVVDNYKKGLKHTEQRTAWRAYVRNLCNYHLDTSGLFLFLDLFLDLLTFSISYSLWRFDILAIVVAFL